MTLYFIPTVPVGGAELFVDCDGCRQNWDPSVLEMDQAHHEALQGEQFRDEVIRASVLVVLADGETTENEITALQRIASRLLEREVERDELGQLCSIALENQIKANNYVLTVSRRWTKTQRSQALQAMFLAATSEGGLGAEQMSLLAELRDILEMSTEEYEAAIEQALEWEST